MSDRNGSLLSFFKCITLLLLSVASFAAIADSLDKEYFFSGEFNQRIIRVVIPSQSDSESVLLVERFGDGLTPETSYADAYIAMAGKYVKILNAKVGEIDDSFSYEMNNENYHIGIRVVGKWHKFFYSALTGEIVDANKKLIGVTHKINVSQEKNRVLLKKEGVKPVFEDKDVILELSDYAERGESLVASGLAYSKNDKVPVYLWSVRILSGGTPDVIKKALDGKDVYKAKLVSSVGVPEYIDLWYSRANNRASASGYRYLSGNKLIDSTGMVLFEKSDPGYRSSLRTQSVQLCEKNVVNIELAGKEQLNSLKVKMISDDGLSTGFQFVDVVESGVLLNYFVKPVSESSILVYVNFSRIEDKRREGGWYSWQGFVIKELDFDCDSGALIK